ncbi:outer membrane protein assembly factor BamA [Pseudomonadota bacterium]|jgi:outer membrane protein insertion porin family|nr:outer membrane protein assembly factor BamA [Pseudomonadota bacterium]
MKFFKRLISFLLLLNITTVLAFEEFIVNDIRIAGLQRVSTGSIFNTIPISVGDKIDDRKIVDITRALFATEQFDDIQIGRDGNALIITVAERPSISSIDISGNSALKTEILLESFDGIGITEGQVYKRSTLERMKAELVRSYSSQGRYGAGVEIYETPQPRNRVSISIEIDEGESAKIDGITILGNNIFSDEDLLDVMELSEGSWLSFLSNDDQYSREKLQGDLENLESYYLDRGYLQFSIESSQVSISRDRSSIYITYIISEGPQYTISDVKIVGDMPLNEELIDPIIETQKDITYSQAQITQIEEIFTSLLGNEGYAFASVKGQPDIDEEMLEVDLSFVIDPGKRTYTRKILFEGNEITQDDVLRREMRQFEGAWASDDKIEQSRVRLERLGFFKEVNVETVPVPGTDDQIDVKFRVEEETTGNVGGNLGYSDFGLMIGFNLQERNFLGTGNSVGIAINKSIYQEVYNLSFYDPYFTIDGASRGYSLYYRKTDYGEFNIANYTSDSQGLGIQFGYPISDTQRVGLNLTYDKTEIDQGTLPVRDILDFLLEEGNSFQTVSAQAVWSRITLNRGMFPTDGASTEALFLATLPLSDINYYKLNIRQKFYQPLNVWDLVFGFQGEIGYLAPYGDTNTVPFFQHFYAGGPRSLRGFESNTLGPRATPSPCYGFDTVNDLCPPLIDSNFDGIPDSPAYNQSIIYQRDDPIGGDVKIEGSMQLIFKLPMVEDQRSMRTAFFFDFGNVFAMECREYQVSCYKPSIDELRYSIGVGLTWITGFGPMSFAISKPYNEDRYERTEEFQFTIGTVF